MKHRGCTNPRTIGIGYAEISDFLQEAGSERTDPVEEYVSGVRGDQDSYNSIPACVRSGMTIDSNSVIPRERPLIVSVGAGFFYQCLPLEIVLLT